MVNSSFISDTDDSVVLARMIPLPEGFSETDAAHMLRSVNPFPLEFLVRLCAIYDEPALRSIGIVLMNEHEDSLYKARADNAEVITFTIIAAPLLAHESMIKAISSNGVAIRKIVPSMLSARYRDDTFSEWGTPRAVHEHVHLTRGAFLKSTIFSPQFDAGTDLLWLGKNFRIVLPLLAELTERQSVDPELINLLHEGRTSALHEGTL